MRPRPHFILFFSCIIGIAIPNRPFRLCIGFSKCQDKNFKTCQIESGSQERKRLALGRRAKREKEQNSNEGKDHSHKEKVTRQEVWPPTASTTNSDGDNCVVEKQLLSLRFVDIAFLRHSVSITYERITATKISRDLSARKSFYLQHKSRQWFQSIFTFTSPFSVEENQFGCSETGLWYFFVDQIFTALFIDGFPPQSPPCR